MDNQRDELGRLWVVARIEEKRGPVANMNLLANGYSTFWVHFHAVMRHARKTETALRSYFPGYIFVGVEDECEIPPIARVRGIGMRDSPEAAILWSPDDKHYLPPAWLKQMRAECLTPEGLHEPPPAIGPMERGRFTPGAEVYCRGPWEKFVAVVLRDTGKIVEVQHGELFGKPVRGEYDPQEVRMA